MIDNGEHSPNELLPQSVSDQGMTPAGLDSDQHQWIAFWWTACSWSHWLHQSCRTVTSTSIIFSRNRENARLLWPSSHAFVKERSCLECSCLPEAMPMTCIPEEPKLSSNATSTPCRQSVNAKPFLLACRGKKKLPVELLHHIRAK